MKSSELLPILARVRRRVRLAVSGWGAARTAAHAVLLFLCAAVVDWWLTLPGLLRAAGVAAFALWLARRVHQDVVRPLFHPVGLAEIAARLGSLRPRDADRLASLAERLEADRPATPIPPAAARATEPHPHPTPGAEALWREVERETLPDLTPDALLRALDLHRVVRSSGAACAAILAVVLLWTLSPEWASTAWARWAWPLGHAKWPRTVSILPLSGSVRLARGDSYPVAMRVVRGGRPALRAWVVTREPGGPPERHVLSRDPDGAYRRVFDAVTRDFEYWFEAGDDSTADTPQRVQVLDRPRVIEAVALVSPPPYVPAARRRFTAALREAPGDSSADLASPTDQQALGGMAVMRRVLDGSPLAVVEGSRIRIEIESSKPPARDAAGRWRAWLRVGASDRPLAALDANGLRFGTEFVAERPAAIELGLVDREGFPSPPFGPIALEITPDAPPTVAILRPDAVIDAAPEADIPFEIEAADDLFLRAVRLAARGRGPPLVIPLRDDSAELNPARDGDSTAEADTQARFSFSPRLSLSALGARPGDLVTCEAFAEDTFEQNGRPREAARSAPVRINVLDRAEMLSRIQSEWNVVRGRLSELVEQQEALIDRARLTRDASSAATRGPDLEHLAVRQRQVADQARHVTDRCAALSERARLNRFRDADLLPPFEAVAREVTRARRPMALAESALYEAGRRDEFPAPFSGKTPGPAPRTADAVERQSEAAAALRAALVAAEQWGGLAELVQRIRELLDRQEALARRGAARAYAAGQDPSALPDGQREDLHRAAGQQRRLGEDAERTLRRVRALSDELSVRDPPTADALARAALTADTAGLLEKLADAARHLAHNRAARALESQREAEAALRTMLAVIERAPDRRLEALSKQLHDLGRRLDRLIDAQRRLLAGTRDAAARLPPPAAALLARHAQQQVSVASTTRSVLRRIDPAGAGAEPLRNDLRSAAVAMDEAASTLGDTRPAAAEPLQIRALAHLREARERLAGLEDQAAQRAAERSRQALREDLLRLRNEQDRLRTDTKAALKRLDGRQSPPRPERLKLAGLAERQEVLVPPLRDVAERLGRSVVFRHVCDAAAETMQHSAARLREADVRASLEGQDAIVTNLDHLVRALEEKGLRGHGRQFAGKGQPGRPGADKKPPTVVPPLAELIALRAMQHDLAAATRRLTPSPGSDEDQAAAQAHIEQARHLGRRQAQLRVLTEQLFRPPSDDDREGPPPPDDSRGALRAADDPSDPEPPRPPRADRDDDLARRLLRGESDDADAPARLLSAMEAARQRLTDKADSGPRTREAQRTALALLDEIIAEARARDTTERARSRAGRTAQRRAGAQDPDRQADARRTGRAGPMPATQPASGVGGAADRRGVTTPGADRDRAWGFLPPRERAEILQGLDEPFPPKYRQYVEQYYRSLADDEAVP